MRRGRAHLPAAEQVASRSHHRELAAVDDQRGAVDERGVVGREERVGGRHLLGPAGPPERDPGVGVGRFELSPADRSGKGLVQRGADVPGAQRVHPDAVASQLHGHGLGEQEDTPLGGVVVRVVLLPGQPVCGRHVDDHTAAAPRHHELRTVAAVEEVDQEPGEEPGEEGHPGHDFETHHQYDAENNAEHGKDGTEGGAEGAVALRLAIAQDEDGDGDEDEGEEGADVGEVGNGADVEQPGGDADHESGDPGGDGGRAEAGMDAAEDGGQQAVA